MYKRERVGDWHIAFIILIFKIVVRTLNMISTLNTFLSVRYSVINYRCEVFTTFQSIQNTFEKLFLEKLNYF